VTVEDFNALPEGAARTQLALCCVAERWVDGMLAARPFRDRSAVLALADDVWATMGEADLLQAFEGHPKIGDVNSLREKYAASSHLASGEQSSVQAADEETIARLAAGNAAYETRFGFIFIVCATGKSAEEMCALLEARLHNPREEELAIAAEEQRKILQLRLEKLL
jgi:2-oxo-4-hydroxy-4-carboxy-5-ureidoimidazoline decarboxylase